MNETCKEQRFHEEKKSTEIPSQEKKSAGVPVQTMLEYCPSLDTAFLKLNYKMTEEKEYPLLEKKQNNSCWRKGSVIKTIDDNGKEVWMSEDHFIPAKRILFGEKTMEQCNWELPDIRKNAKEQNIGPVDENIMSECKDIMGRTFGDCFEDALVLTGLSQKDIPHSIKDVLNEFEEKTQLRNKKVHSCWQGSGDGRTSSTVNELMNDPAKCAAAVSRVFGGGEVIDPDDILVGIKDHFSRNIQITREEGYLLIDGAKTKISFDTIQDSFQGLCKITTPVTAKKIVSKIIAKKIKKLF